jgi:hypothetical protein
MIRELDYGNQLGLGLSQGRLLLVLNSLPPENTTLRPRLQLGYNNIFGKEIILQDHAIVFFYKEELEELLTYIKDKDTILEKSIKKWLNN